MEFVATEAPQGNQVLANGIQQLSLLSCLLVRDVIGAR